MVDVKKGQKIWIEIEATEDMKVETQKDLWAIYGGKTVIDKYETTSIIWNNDYFKEQVKSELTKKLLDLGLLDSNMLNDIAYNMGGIK